MGKYEKILRMERPNSRRVPMDRERRAKQFAPFAALKGFEDCIEAKTVLHDHEDIYTKDPFE